MSKHTKDKFLTFWSFHQVLFFLNESSVSKRIQEMNETDSELLYLILLIFGHRSPHCDFCSTFYDFQRNDDCSTNVY